MPRRPARPPPQQQPDAPDAPDAPDRDSLLYADLDPDHARNLRTLRSHWKWAAFSQFFYTFAPLLAIPDVSLTDIEDDLARPSILHISRIMQRLLLTLTQDRKINADNWQSALRKQYYKRLPEANPLGPEPHAVHSDVDDDNDGDATDARDDTAQTTSDPPEHHPDASVDHAPDTPAAPATQEPPILNGHADPSTPAQGTPLPEPLKREPKRKSKATRAKAGSRGQSRRAPSKEPTMQFQGDSKDWFDLTLLEKLDSLHLLVEWQFQNPQRLRQLMKDDDETAQWRIEPIGYDSKINAYWLIGPDRLWIQRALPKPQRPAKRKRAPAKPKTIPAKNVSITSDEDEHPPTSNKRKRSDRLNLVHANATPTSSLSRAAKVQANKKLDAQAKELAEFQRQTAASTRTRGNRQRQSSPQKPSAAPGTRVSARLRGFARDEEEWQKVPDEWLNPSSSKADGKDEEGPKAGGDVVHAPDTAGDLSDDISELTELSDSSASEVEESIPSKPSPTVNGARKHGGNTKKLDTPDDDEHVPEETPQIPPNFVEWELICLTLYDWERIADQFAKATHYLEKALYKLLSQSIVPVVTEELREIERKRKVEEALVHRKRSSRIALKEVEKEEARAAAIRKAEEAEKDARAQRAEARAKKEQAEREKRERAREQRRLEREGREERARKKEERSKHLDLVRLQSGSATPSNTSVSLDRHRTSDSIQLSRVASRSSTSTPDWVLDCEICHKNGVNLDDGLPMVSCGSCSRWQHITCHDHADLTAGRPRRNWESQQFYCQRCRQIIQSRRMTHAGTQPFQASEQQRYQQTHYAQKPQLPVGYSIMQAQMYRQPTDLRYSQQPVYSADSRGDYSGNHRSAATASAYPTPHLPHHSSNSYGQYSSDQRGTYASGSSRPSPLGAPNGYPATTDLYRHQPPVPVPQRSAMYDTPAMTSLHQNSSYSLPQSSSSQYHHESYPASQSRWSGGGEQYYTSSNGIPSRSNGDLAYHSQDLRGGSGTWTRHSDAAIHGERDGNLQQPSVVSPSGYTPTYNYPGP